MKKQYGRNPRWRPNPQFWESHRRICCNIGVQYIKIYVLTGVKHEFTNEMVLSLSQNHKYVINENPIWQKSKMVAKIRYFGSHMYVYEVISACNISKYVLTGVKHEFTTEMGQSVSQNHKFIIYENKIWRKSKMAVKICHFWNYMYIYETT